MTRFGMLRHGETVWNHEHRIQGHSDSALTKAGVAYAKACGEALTGLGYERILSSDLGRARRTAELINASLSLPLSTDARLREQDWGAWVGRTVPELRRNEGAEMLRQEGEGWGFRPGGGESRYDVLARAEEALHDAWTRNPGGRILVVTHQGVLRCLLYKTLGHDFRRGAPDPVAARAFHELDYDGERLVLRNLNLEIT